MYGDVVQIKPHVYDEFPGAFIFVEIVTGKGVEGFISQSKNESNDRIQVKRSWHEIAYIGPSHWQPIQIYSKNSGET
jgi:hypothetical protein